jgi:DNA repair protein SbcC/Rad50
VIPVRLYLRNFMSYGDAGVSLDFTTFRIACLCGDNGHGKSALLDAITWALWGRTRAGGRSERDVIRLGATAASVELEFVVPDGQRERVYRVKRERPRTGTGSVELQVHDGDEYRPLTGISVSDTQSRIEKLVRLDYDTFINSAYIMQGRADEFMRKRPGERKELLVNLLGLSIYDDLARRAREKAGAYDRDLAETARLIAAIDRELVEEPALRAGIDRLNGEIEVAEAEAARLDAAVQALRARLAALTARAQEATGVRLRLEQLSADSRTLAVQRDRAEMALATCRAILRRADDIRSRRHRLESLREEETRLAEASRALHALSERRSVDAAEIERERVTLSAELSRARQKATRAQQLELTGPTHTRLQDASAALLQCHAVLTRADDIRGRSESLASLQREVRALENAARRARELAEQRASATGQIEHERGQETARLASLQQKLVEAHRAESSIQEQHRRVTALAADLARLDQLVVERDGLIARRESVGADIARLQADNTRLRDDMNVIKERMDYLRRTEQEPLCPVCRTPLDVAGRHRLLAEYETEGKAKAAVYRSSQSEIARFEAEVNQSSARIDEASRRLRGRDNTSAQLTQAKGLLEQAQLLASEVTNLAEGVDSVQRALERGDFARVARTQLAQIDADIAAVGYDAQRHHLVSVALGRLSDVPRELDDLANATAEEPRLMRILADLQEQAAVEAAETIRLAAEADALSERLDSGEFAHAARERLLAIEAEMSALGYDGKRHTAIRGEITTMVSVEQELAALERAESDESGFVDALSRAVEQLARNERWTNEETKRLGSMQVELRSVPVIEAQEREAEDERDACTLRLSHAREDRAATQQKLRDLDVRRSERAARQVELDTQTVEAGLHRDLEKALGKNGIQAAIIEAVLPELEGEANSILSAMTNGLMAVKIETERAAVADDHIISTLDIHVADEVGTRPIEMYSGGESFRINFAIRVALSKLLARRAGAQMRTLVIDEGFGSQDNVGRQRLVEAIGAVSGDFDKIIVVTHIEELKDAFPTRIDVYKDADLGSQITVSHE